MNIYSDQYKYRICNCIMVLFSITEVLYVVYVTWLVCMFVLNLGGNSTGIYSGLSKHFKQQLQDGPEWFHSGPVSLVTYMGQNGFILVQLALCHLLGPEWFHSGPVSLVSPKWARMVSFWSS